MARNAVLLTLFLITVHIQHVLSITPQQYCFYGCNSVMYTISFTDGYDPCTNPIALETNYYCAARYCSEAEINAGISLFVPESKCEHPIPDFDSVLRGVKLDSIPIINYTAAVATYASKADALDHVVLPDEEFFDIAFRTVVSIHLEFV